jgi:hypothetical protein
MHPVRTYLMNSSHDATNSIKMKSSRETCRVSVSETPVTIVFLNRRVTAINYTGPSSYKKRIYRAAVSKKVETHWFSVLSRSEDLKHYNVSNTKK